MINITLKVSWQKYNDSLLICWTQVYMHWSISYSYISWVKLNFHMLLNNYMIIKWSVKTMLWLGEGCSFHEHDKSLGVWYIKEWVNNGFVDCSHLVFIDMKVSVPCKCSSLTSTCWCVEYVDLLYYSLSPWTYFKMSQVSFED